MMDPNHEENACTDSAEIGMKSVEPASLVGKIVVGVDMSGNECFVAEAAGYFAEPTYIFARASFQAWRADLVRAATPEQEAAYWRSRALQAEGKETVLRG